MSRKFWLICLDCEQADQFEDTEGWMITHWGHDAVMIERSEGQVYTYILQTKEPE